MGHYNSAREYDELAKIKSNVVAPDMDEELKNKVKIGDTIPIAEEHIEHIKAIKAQMDDFNVMLRNGANGYKQAEKQLWDFLKVTMPETDGFNMNLSHVDHVVNIIGEV